MFSVIFEVHPNDGRKDDYLEQAKHLKPILETVDGFIDNERFESRLRPGWILSHSTWRDEKSVVRWRTEGEHHAVQEKGRFEIFSDYFLRIGDITADTAPPAGIPVREQRFDETEVGTSKIATFTEITPAKGATFATQIDLLPAYLGLDINNGDVTDHDIWSSIHNPGKIALLIGWTNAGAAGNWQPKRIEGIESLRHRMVRVVRTYGRFDRREAPQFYPDVKGRETKHAVIARKAAGAAG
ncbi:antibiotic biosynthesis monooxygenase family protein [Bradyrhizobium septentrionale]|uniref:Antibiotic biosynthesis monooxygenase n=1 Tax=Bradyrhizobium septentrionale TaxID=1404411 RepID=A0A973ZZM2_9BRAD|nr:antibiotic biosynthesis monooxygenase [Bradyrhizobium septentrionale]UGY19884.1 antibiotic biosynthesis monooxygenase [Bradyrhizobium septentrionale]